MGLFDIGSGVAGIVAPLVTGIIGQNAAAGARGEANNAMNLALQEILAVNPPPDQARQIVLDKFKSAGILTPELEQQINSKFSEIAPVDQDLQKAQKEALSQMAQRSQGGLTPSDRAALAQIQQESNVATQGQEGALRQEMQARGLAGGGSELAARLSAAQSGANRLTNAGLQIGGQASQNALQALGQYGQMAGQDISQQFGMNQNRAQAENEMSRFNTSNQLAQQQRNVQNQNQAQYANLANQQNTMNLNTQQANQELLRQRQGEQQNFNNQMQIAGARAGAYQGRAGQLENQANQTAAGWANIGSGLGSGFGALSGNAFKAGTSKAPSSNDNVAYSGDNQYGFGNMASQLVPGFSEGGEVLPEYKEGGVVPGVAKHEGDHPDNDTVTAKLSPGELVIPRSVAKSSIGKKLAALLEAHHQLRKELEPKG